MEHTIYNQRLLQFADHLAGIINHPDQGLTEEVELVSVEKKKRTHYKVKFHAWLFEELPMAFNEWYYSDDSGSPLYEGADPEEGTIVAAVKFFHITQDEFCHLFDLDGLQDIKRFGGEELSKMSNGIAIARNIIALVENKKII